MAQKSTRPRKNNLLSEINELLEQLSDAKTEYKAEVRKKKGCTVQVGEAVCGKLVYKKEMCQEHYEIYANINNEKKSAGEPWISTNGYKYCYDADGKPTLYHRKVVSDFLGRTLKRSEKVIFKDGDRSNCSPDNLLLHSANAVDLSSLRCPHCGRSYKENSDSTGENRSIELSDEG